MTTLQNARPKFARDRWGRPLVTPPNGGKPVAYTRCTTYVDVLEDKFNLQKWMQRMVALGLAQRPDLLLAVSAHKDDKSELDKICEKAREAAASSAAATTGTALHALTEVVDTGGELPPLPADAAADLEAYKAATADLKSVHIEAPLVLDALKIGGTADRVVEYDGERYIADIKTGSIEYGALKIAMQLAVYARSWLYDISTGKRTAHGASVTRGIIIHLPAGEAHCELVWVDLKAGWEAVRVAKQVREQRGRKFAELTTPFGTEPEAPEPEPRPVVTLKQALTPTRLPERIHACTTADEVRTLWAEHAHAWNDVLTELAREHIASLNEPPAAS